MKAVRFNPRKQIPESYSRSTKAWSCKCCKCNNPTDWPKWERTTLCDFHNINLRVYELFLRTIQDGKTTFKFEVHKEFLFHQDTGGDVLFKSLTRYPKDYINVTSYQDAPIYVYTWHPKNIVCVIQHILIRAFPLYEPIKGILEERHDSCMKKLRGGLSSVLDKGNASMILLALICDLVKHREVRLPGFRWLYECEWEQTVGHTDSGGRLIMGSDSGVFVIIEVKYLAFGTESDTYLRKTKRQMRTRMIQSVGRFRESHGSLITAVIGATYTNYDKYPIFYTKEDHQIFSSVGETDGGTAIGSETFSPIMLDQWRETYGIALT
ncbi:9866_t:CDS:1 [Paraglomus brasilianum]|uniref:9866_t:CDS:1 n=1 Tax=Paraglomus brasilianum TaxID=144538 RepID=A0A9N9GZP5_9GLOM|nr:9866_t:CDS:1 [Paraglomus brasilianum]